MPYNMDATDGIDTQITASKPKRAVSITLDVSSDDNVRFRQFTLKPSSQAIRVGRSSRNDENFMPGVQNAWFESRVISRNHATIRAVPDEQKLCLFDENSMHGSFVNGKKVANREMHPLLSGDKIVFGSDIVRGPEKFAPVVAKIDFEWHEDLSPKASHLPNRSFVVPCDSDYDDDEVEFIQESILKPNLPMNSGVHSSRDTRKFSVPESDVSSAGSFNHDEPSKIDELPVSAFKLHKDMQDPITSNIRAESANARLVTPAESSRLYDTEKFNQDLFDAVMSTPTPIKISTPLHVSEKTAERATNKAESGNRLGTVSDGPTVLLKELTRESVDTGLTDSDSDEAISLRSLSESPCSPIESVSSPVDVTEDSFKDKQGPSNRGRKLEAADKINVPSCGLESFDDSASDGESIHTDRSESSGSDISDTGSNAENIPASPHFPRGLHPFYNQENIYPTPTPPLRKGPLSGIEPFDLGRHPSPSDAAMAKPAVPPPIPPASQYRPSIWNSPYPHVPMTSDYKFYRPEWGTPYSSFDRPPAEALYTFDSSAPVQPYTEGPFSASSNFKYDFYGHPDPVFDEPRTQRYSNVASTPNPIPKTTTKVSIDSIVEKPQTTAQEHLTSSLKRKFADISRDDEESTGSQLTQAPIEDAFPDTQIPADLPADVPSTPEAVESAVSQISDTEVSTSEPPTKRLKFSVEQNPAQHPTRRPSRTKQFAKYAATAVGGAVFGAVGVVGALVALPEGFFS
ncbi:MAG: hypothetical protein Q9160_001855 [Pyrenula sp. 1 TL-2023]